MHENVIRLLMENAVQQIYVTNRGTAATARKVSGALHCEVSTNEKIAFELALAGAYVRKRTACILSTEGLYEALDPVMSSAYTGVAGSFVIVAVQENDEEVTPLGPFSKLPLIVTEKEEELEGRQVRARTFRGVTESPLSYSRPGRVRKGRETAGNEKTAGNAAMLVKEPGRWAATPKFRFHLHGELNEKIRKIGEAFETYEDNLIISKGSTGLVTDRLSRLEFYDEDASVLRLATVFPLPQRLVQGFVDGMDEVLVVETYPAIELQIPDRSKVKRGFVDAGRGTPQYDEVIAGFSVIRDRLGPASSINMAHGIKRLHPERNILAVTFEDHFFHSGMPAYVNSLYNDSSFVLLVMVSEREDDLRRILRGYGVSGVHSISNIDEIARFRDTKEPVVALYRGMI